MNLIAGISSTSRVWASLVFSIATMALAQQTQPPAFPPPTALRPPGLSAPEDIVRDSNMPDPAQGLMRVDVAVTDKSGKSVTGLSKEDFTLFDNNDQREIVTFQAFNGGIQPATSLEVVLVINEVNQPANVQSGKIKLSAADREAETLLRSHAGELPHPTIVYRLTDRGLFATPHISVNGNELADEIEHGPERRVWSPSEIDRAIGKIASGEEVLHSLVALGSIAIEERRRPGRKLMFWIGDGWEIEGHRGPWLSDLSIELLTRMREARISMWGSSEWPLYDLSGNPVPVNYHVDQYLHGPRNDSTDLAYLSLPIIAARSGGGMLNTRDNLAALIYECVDVESRYYSVTFDPPRTDVVDEYHHLRMKIGQADTTAHSFEDYYDEPVFYDQPPVKQSVTVKELETLIEDARHVSGAELVHQLEGVRLIERLDGSKAARLEKKVRGSDEREALQTVADESVFLVPPANEILSAPPPDMAEQHQILSNTISYINTIIPKLPDFSASRTTVQYQELLPKPNQTWKTATGDGSLHQGETATASIRFHDGKERVENQSVTDASSPQLGVTVSTVQHELMMNSLQRFGSEQLTTIGTFGPILVTVMTAATLPHSQLEWVRWEQGEGERLAVFRYRVPQETSLFFAEFCCLARDLESVLFKEAAPFHGEITVDPSTGAILRLTTQADLAWRLPLQRSDVMVEYRPVVKGTRTFICPARAVSISRHRRTMVISEWGENFKVYAPFETLRNEMRFEKYHIFGSTSRMLPGFIEVPDDK